jgi:hypothetical protein
MGKEEIVCKECNSNKNVEKRGMNTGEGILGDLLCKSCFQNLLYEFMD